MVGMLYSWDTSTLKQTQVALRSRLIFTCRVTSTLILIPHSFPQLILYNPSLKTLWLILVQAIKIEGVIIKVLWALNRISDLPSKSQRIVQTLLPSQLYNNRANAQLEDLQLKAEWKRETRILLTRDQWWPQYTKRYWKTSKSQTILRLKVSKK